MSEPQVPRQAPATAPLKLADLRGQLIRQEETIIFALIERAQFAANPGVYSRETDQLLGLDDPAGIGNRFHGRSFLDFMLGETEKLHSLVRRYTAPDEHAFFPVACPAPVLPPLDMPRLIAPNSINIGQKIMSVYEQMIIPELCSDPGDDGNYGSCTVTDIAALQALSKRIHFGKFIAEAKFQSDPPKYGALIRARDAAGIMAELTKPAVEVQVLKRVRLKASTYGRDPQHVDEESYKVSPDLITELYRTWVMPLTKEVQVAYLLQRLDPSVCAFVGFALPAEVALVSAAEVAARQCLERDHGKPIPGTPLFKYVAHDGVDEVIASVKCNAAHFGVLDLESTDFGVHRIAFRALIDSKLFITAEIWRSVRCSAIVNEATAWPSAVSTFKVYGTQNALDRASIWIAGMVPPTCTRFQRIVVLSDGEAIHSIAEGHPSMCLVAIIETAPGQARSLAGLRPVADASSGPPKRIRTVVLEKMIMGPSGDDRSAVAFSLGGTTPGELSTALELFTAKGINMVQIQSLAPTNPDDIFSFYVEIDGHAEDPDVVTALTSLRKLAKRVDLLGSYMISRSTQHAVAASADNTPVVQTVAGRDAQRRASTFVAPAVTPPPSHPAGLVAYLGPEATYSNQAALMLYGPEAKYLPGCKSIAEVVAAVTDGRAEYAVVPYENSSCGAVEDTLQLLGTTRLTVVAEHNLAIRHCLLSPGPLAEVTEVHSKLQAIQQCSGWLKANLPNAKTVACQSSSHAVGVAKAGKGIAAIASSLSSDFFEVPTLAAGINDDVTNTTRFVVLAAAPAPADADQAHRTSFFAAPTAVDGIIPLLAALDRRRLRLMGFTSRSAGNGPWRKEFFFDCAGHVNDALVSEALREMQESSGSVRCLGSYVDTAVVATSAPSE